MWNDSQMFVSWPDWHAPGGRDAARAALSRARERRSMSLQEDGKWHQAFMSETSAACEFHHAMGRDRRRASESATW